MMDGSAPTTAQPASVQLTGAPSAGLPAIAAPVAALPLGLGAAVEPGRAVGRLHVLVVEGLDFGMGPGLTPPVAASLEPLTERVRKVLAAWQAVPK